ncbi:exonuclease [Donghicola sp. C2-DW-16]|uniref:Exonuclease n=2 Tax=Donghicola mangrovi TaxID=2729614 RepID=A0ABX2PFT2_9RHOB|nr:exonuclease [Donghicola mangrovi]
MQKCAAHGPHWGNQHFHCAGFSGIPVPPKPQGQPMTLANHTAATAPLTGEFRFFALDVETANRNRSSICQIGIAGVRPDNSIETWSTYVDPVTDDWSCTRIHGITARTVIGAPLFPQLVPVLDGMLKGLTVYQHSHFDKGAINSACGEAGLVPPAWKWMDSLIVARRAWPELRGNGGHGLASLKTYLKLEFEHHDAEEDARAAAEVVLHAERRHAGA